MRHKGRSVCVRYMRNQKRRKEIFGKKGCSEEHIKLIGVRI